MATFRINQVELRSSTLFVSILFILTITSCSKGASSGPQDNSAPISGLAEGQKLALSAGVNCADPSSCSPSVGMLVGITEKTITACTASLIAPDILATNSHCIPEDLKSSGSDCSGRLWINFPSISDYKASRIECEKIISASKIPPEGSHDVAPDYAFIRLKSASDRTVLSISHDGFQDGALYSLLKIDPTFQDHVPQGVLNQTNCKALLGTAALARADRAGAPLMALAECDVIHGNSGSPILDSSGKMHGLIQASMDVAGSPDFLEKLHFLDGELSKAVDEEEFINVATSYSCIAPPSETASSLSAVCIDDGQESSREKSHAQQMLSAELRDAMKAITVDDTLGDWTKLREMPIGAYVPTPYAPTDYDRFFIPVPTCFRSVDAWIGIDDPDSTSGTRYRDFPVLHAQFGYNRYYQWGVQVDQLPVYDKLRLGLRVDIPGLQVGKSELTLDGIYEVSGALPVPIKYDFPKCPNAPQANASSN
jgi:hypothetical protein